MKNRHEVELVIVDDNRTIATCHCGYRALFTVEHLDNEELIPFNVEVFNYGEPGARHAVMLGSSSTVTTICALPPDKSS